MARLGTVSRSQGRTPTIPRRVTDRWMRNSALHYLGRYTATTEQFRRVMTRRIDRSLAHHGGDRAEALEALDRLVTIHMLSTGEQRDLLAELEPRLQVHALGKKPHRPPPATAGS